MHVEHSYYLGVFDSIKVRHNEHSSPKTLQVFSQYTLIGNIVTKLFKLFGSSVETFCLDKQHPRVYTVSRSSLENFIKMQCEELNIENANNEWIQDIIDCWIKKDGEVTFDSLIKTLKDCQSNLANLRVDDIAKYEISPICTQRKGLSCCHECIITLKNGLKHDFEAPGISIYTLTQAIQDSNKIWYGTSSKNLVKREKMTDDIACFEHFKQYAKNIAPETGEDYLRRLFRTEIRKN